jgi:hypothetical protein
MRGNGSSVPLRNRNGATHSIVHVVVAGGAVTGLVEGMSRNMRVEYAGLFINLLRSEASAGRA